MTLWPDLQEFLFARIAEDEEAARAVPQGHWRISEEDPTRVLSVEAMQDRTPLGGDVGAHVASGTWPEEAAHIARWSPARVLAECAAKREVVEDVSGWDGGDYGSGREWQHDETLRLLARAYAEHPDYRQEWRA